MSAIVEGAPTEGIDDVQAMFDLSKKKKKKSKKTTEEGASSSSADGQSNAVTDAPTYTYSHMLNRIVTLLQQNNPELAEKRRNTIKPPQLMRVGTKKTLWVNFNEICKMMRRSSEHVFQYMLAELGTEGSIDGQQRLVIKGKFIPKYIEQLLRKYIIEYVTCQMCRSFNTNLTKDSVSRLHFVHCQDCGSSRSVTQIKAGFHAQTKADRRAVRNAV
jgi:translation initiation factor 2 subunit 2